MIFAYGKFTTSEFSIFLLASKAKHAGLGMTWSKNPKRRGPNYEPVNMETANARWVLLHAFCHGPGISLTSRRRLFPISGVVLLLSFTQSLMEHPCPV